MNRRELLTALPALSEVTAPSTPEAALRAAVQRWLRAEQEVERAMSVYQGAARGLRLAVLDGASEHTLARLINNRVALRAEWRAAVREQAAAEEEMETRARFVREG